MMVEAPTRMDIRPRLIEGAPVEHEFRCAAGHFLAWLALASGSTVRIKCLTCRTWYVFRT